MLRAPNGVLEDVNNYFAAGKPLYDPGKIAVPTFLIHAEWERRSSELSGAGIFHQVDQRALPPLCRVERRNAYGDAQKNRMQFFREILNFLNEERPLALK